MQKSPKKIIFGEKHLFTDSFIGREKISDRSFW